MTRSPEARRAAVLEVRHEIRAALASAAREALPRECCGLLIGRGSRVELAVPAPNRAPGLGRYEIDPRTHLDWQRLLRAAVPPVEVIGAYHSHPDGAPRPSSRDVAEAHDPLWVHLIVAPARGRPRFAAFRIAHGAVERLQIRWRRTADREVS